MISGEDYTWTAIGDTLIIEVLKAESYTMDLLPPILKDIIALLSLPFAEQIRRIELRPVPGVTIWEATTYRRAGKLGPWARGWPRDVRYLATGPQKQPVYRRIKQAGKEGDSWRYVRVRLEGETDVRSCWCGTNIYEEV